MINLKDKSSLNYTNLDIINGKIKTLNDIISYQADEISKSKTSISTFQKCLTKQNEVLDKFIAEKEKLSEEKAKRLKLTQHGENDCKEIYESVMKMGAQSTNRRRINRETIKSYENMSGVKMETETIILQKMECDVDLQVTLESNRDQSPNEALVCNENAVETRQQVPPKRTKIQLIENKRIHKIVIFGDDIFVGASKGMLLKYNNRKSLVYSTNTQDDILQIEIWKHHGGVRLFAFTKDKGLVYNAMGVFQHSLPLPGMGNVYTDVSLLYIPLRDGVIKKLLYEECQVKDHIVHEHGDVRCFVPGRGKNNFALVRLQDGVVYRSEKKDLRGLVPIDGLTGIRRIMKVRYSNSLCFSDKRIWFFNADFDVIQTMEIEAGIKFVEVIYSFGAVVDCSNTVHMYPLLDSGFFGDEICERRIRGNVTSLTLFKKNVILAVGCDILTLENIL